VRGDKFILEKGLNNGLILVFVRFFQCGPTFVFFFNLILVLVNFIQVGPFR